jgi:endonuclease/exonuclease/phosphatase family metal-dependent hydrolase
LKKRPGYRIVKSILVSLNFAVVVALVFSLLAAYIPPSSQAVFSVFGLIYPLLLIANIVFVILWALLKSRMFFVSLLVILLGYNNLLQNVQFSFNGDDETPKKTIQLFTYNVERFGLYDSEEKFRKTRKEVIQFIKSKNPGIVCLQEYHGKGKTLYEPLQQIKTELGADSYYYESYFNPRYQQLTGLIIFSKYKAVSKGKLKFENSRTFGIYTDLIIHGDTVRTYNIHLASIQLMPADIDFVVNPGKDKEAKLHALRIYSKLSEAFQLREKQMAFLVDKIKKSPYPTILCGDFNDPPSSFVYNKITNILDDCFVEKGKGLGRTYAGELPLLRIDYILKSHEFISLEYRRHKIHFSDHFPVSVTLKRIEQ